MTEPQNALTGKSYQIKVEGHLDENWADWFEGLTFTHESDGTTTINAENIDQATLHGLLKRIRDLGIPLLAVNRLNPDQTVTTNPNQPANKNGPLAADS